MRDMVMQATNGNVEKPPPYTMQLLLEEVTTLRNRVKELEEDDGHSGRTAPSLDSSDSVENHDVATLRKKLMKCQNDRAELEKDFMNQLTIMAQEHHETVDDLKKQLKMMQCEKNIIKANGSFEQSEEIFELETQVSQLKDVIAAQGDEETQQLVSKLSAAQKEAKDARDEIKDLHQQIQDLDSQKSTLLEEITHLRIDYDKEAKTVLSLRTEMEQVDKEYRLQVEKFQHDFVEQEETIQQHEESFGEMNDSVVELEGQKALLLDEITSLRLQLDREKQTIGEMKTRIEELTAATMEAGDYKLASMEQRATAAEANASKLQDTINQLQDELRSVTASYKSDKARLEERLTARDSQLQELKESVEEKNEELSDAQQKVIEAAEEAKTLRQEIEEQQKVSAEKEHEIASMVSQRISYEKRAAKNVMDHVAEADDLRAQCKALEKEVKVLKDRLHKEIGMPTRPPSSKLSSGMPTRPPSTKFSSGPKHFRFDRSPPPAPPAAVSPAVSSSRGQVEQDVTPRTAVLGIVAKFERISAASSSNAGNSDSVPTDCRSPIPSTQCEAPDESDISLSSEEAEAFKQTAEKETHEIRQLQEQLQRQSELIGELRAEIATLTATRGAHAILAEKEHANKSRDDEELIKSLEKKLEVANCQLESETELVKALREELNILALEKMNHQQKTDSSLGEQKAHKMELNKLANAVTAAQMEKANVERELNRRIKELEDTIETINVEIDEELAAKDQEMELLQRQLDEQIESVKRMETEREQICTNVNSISNAKKAEIDELQEALLAKTATAAAQAREIDSLLVQVEKQKDATEELQYLRFKVRDLEKKSNGSMSKAELNKMMAENQKLNESIRKMSMERRALQDKLTVVMSEKTSSKSVQVLRDRNLALKQEVERLSRRVRKSEKLSAAQRIEI